MKHSISLIAPAKLNLNLYVKDKLENGYHSLESDVCFLDLHDEICLLYTSPSPRDPSISRMPSSA